MKLRIKLVSAFVFLALISVFFFQFYWLKSFYVDQSTKMEVDILTALKNADYKEIYWRLSMLRQDSAMLRDPMGTYLHMQKDKKDSTTIDVTIMYDAEEMLKYFQKGLHQSLGTAESIDFSSYNNLLQIELTQKGIMLQSFTEMIDLRNSAVLKCLPADTSKIDRSDYQSFLYPFDVDGNYAYRLNVKQPRLFVLKQMSGILGTSLLMIVFVVLSYVYLLKTIFKQKSLDEIKSDFVNNMTHELKTPISVAYAVNDALLNFGMMDDPVKRKEYLNVSREQLMHLNSLVEQILTMSVEERKNLKFALEDIKIEELFNHLKNQYLLNASKEVTFDIEVDPDDLIIKADKVHFQNVISNLIENSIKYSYESVHIKLKAIEDDEHTIITVEDNGMGIPSSSTAKIFDRFYRVPSGNIHPVKGYGLGLYYVKTIMDKHGWTIKVESKEGKGTVFNLII